MSIITYGSESPTCTVIYLSGLNLSRDFDLHPCSMLATCVIVAVPVPPHRMKSNPNFHNQTEIIKAFNSISRYLDGSLNIDNPYFEQMVGPIYPTELQLNKANSSDTEAPFFYLNLTITNGIVSSQIYDKQDDFNFEILNFPFLDRDVPSSLSYGVYISQLIRFC